MLTYFNKKKYIFKILKLHYLLLPILILIFYFMLNFQYRLNTTYANTYLSNNADSFTLQPSEKTIDDLNALNINSNNYVVFDRLSNTVIFGRDENISVPMASTTKIMTAIIVLENIDLNELVEISKNASSIGGSVINVSTGDVVTVLDLLYGLLLASGNDAAIALAEHTAGSIENFSILMNTKAKELGLSNTNFESPHGLDSENHFTTATELAILSDYALSNEMFLKIVGTKQYTITIDNYTRTLTNTNELLGNYEGIYGVKTGFTNGANRCLVTACKQDDMDLICVVLGADTKDFRTSDSKKLLDYAFDNYSYVNIYNIINEDFKNWKTSNLENFNINKGYYNEFNVHFYYNFPNIIPINDSDASQIQTSINATYDLVSPLDFKDSLGIIKTTFNESSTILLNIFSEEVILKKNVHNYLNDFISNFDVYLSFN